LNGVALELSQQQIDEAVKAATAVIARSKQ